MEAMGDKRMCNIVHGGGARSLFITQHKQHEIAAQSRWAIKCGNYFIMKMLPRVQATNRDVSFRNEPKKGRTSLLGRAFGSKLFVHDWW